MVIKLHIKYRTQYGQTLYIRIKKVTTDSNEILEEIKMEYLNDEYWHLSLNTDELELEDSLHYDYLIKETWKGDINDLCTDRKLHWKKIKADQIAVYDEWQEVALHENVFRSKPFDLVLDKHKIKHGKKEKAKKSTHQFKVFVPYLQDDKVICMAGSAKEMNDWSEQEPTLLHKTNDCWSISLNLNKEKYPIGFKFGVYSLTEKKVIYFEEGSNRFLENKPGKDKFEVFHCFPRFDQYKWKGAGINISVSALKSENSWGVGDFTDLNLLTDWSKKAGFKLIQLLPINDTTATHSKKDSYPYASISAFALHPLYLNVKKLQAAAGIELTEVQEKELAALNNNPVLEYEQVLKIKTDAIKELYYLDKLNFKDDFGFFEFFDLNRYWLVPYAAFCYLRDHNNTANASLWEDLSTYEENLVQEFVSPDNAHYDDIALHYFTQYHLHLQLLDAVEYAHKNGIVLKGDLPIGVGRHSVETWMHPTLFHMDMQAGAPPDAFAVKGQNWEFPTYNWEEMAKNNYAWWRQRMEHMSNYFDAIRIDHILGFFRIWSIPHNDIEGILGIFEPALPVSKHQLEFAGIVADEKRLCDPFITDGLIDRKFGEDAAWVRENITSNGRFREQVNTQLKLAAFLKKRTGKAHLQQALFDLGTDIILIRDAHKPEHFHFRIGMQQTDSFKHLGQDQQQKLNVLYQQYFFQMQNELWKEVGQKKLDALQMNTEMLLCAEDLGMVPDFVEDVLKGREMLSLEVQRMSKKSTERFAHPGNAYYLSVVTPSTHDMSTVREWWEEDRENTQYFYNQLLGQYGDAPFYCEPWICREIIRQHLDSPAMWAIFLLQDIMALDANSRRVNPAEERINVPADSDHTWDYRMHITLETLLEQTVFLHEFNSYVKQGGR